jgi:hypothetical protein
MIKWILDFFKGVHDEVYQQEDLIVVLLGGRDDTRD